MTQTTVRPPHGAGPRGSCAGGPNRGRQQTGNRSRWVLPDDGIIDPIAVEIAASGTRPVALTPPERRLAAAAILAAGGTPWQVATRLHVSGHTAQLLCRAARQLLLTAVYRLAQQTSGPPSAREPGVAS